MRKTKIICTLGPASESESTLREMIKAGMNVARFNFSHGSYEEHQKRLDVVKKLRKELDVPLATLLDTKGPEIRLGKLKDGKAVLQEGNPFVLTTEDLLGWNPDVILLTSDEREELKADSQINGVAAIQNDAMYLVPFQIVGYYLMWNKDLFTEAGLDPETPPQNWDEWLEYAKAITNEDKNVYGSGISYNYAYQIAHIIQRFGGLAVTNEDGAWKANFAGNEGYAAFLNMYKEMIDGGYNPIDADTDPTFTAGQLGMTVTGPWTTGGLDSNGINYGIALVPEGMAGPMNSVEVIGFAVTNVVSEEEQLAAYRFIEWWNTEDAEGNSPALTWSLENGFPSYAFSVQEKESYKSNEKLVVTSSADPSLPSDFIVDSSFAGTNEILNDVILPLMSSITFEDISVEDALANAQAAAEEIVARYN